MLDIATSLDLFTIRNYVQDICERLVDVIGFHSGCAYRVEITGVIGPKQEHNVFGVDLPCAQSSDGDSMEALNLTVGLSLSNRQLALSLADIREAIRRPNDTAFHCFRVLESIRVHFEKKCSKDAAWAQMANMLNVDKTVKDYVAKLAREPRHGRPATITGEEREKCISLARQIIDRFRHFLAGGEKVLDRSLYPLLSETERVIGPTVGTAVSVEASNPTA